MTKAGERMLCRETTVTHTPTGYVITITNADIPVDQYQPKHSEQRDRALLVLCGKLGRMVDRGECLFDFRVVEVN